MGEIAMNLATTRNFLHCLCLRDGTLMILWGTLLACFYLFWIVLSAANSSSGNDRWFLLLGTIPLCVGESLSVFTLAHFPWPNITYSPTSRTAKLLKYSAWYYGFFTAIGAVAFLGSCLTAAVLYIEEDVGLAGAFIFYYWLATVYVLSIWIAVFKHCMAVVYSFYLSILPIEHCAICRAMV